MNERDDRGHQADDEAVAIPVSRALAVLWGHREYPSKGPKPGLSLTRILDAGIHVAQTDGLAAVSMKRVAGELGTAAMSLYRYVSGKDELLTLMAAQATGAPPSDLPTPSESWREGLTRWAALQRTIWRQHPWALTIPITGPPTTPNEVRWLERGLRCLTDTGLTETEKLGAVLLVTGFVRNEATLTADLTAALQHSEQPSAAVGYGPMLREFTDPERFPALTRLLASGILDGVEETAAEVEDSREDDYVFGLERILDGIGVLIQSRTAS